MSFTHTSSFILLGEQVDPFTPGVQKHVVVPGEPGMPT